MIGYKRRLSVCGSNCCGNAPRLDDPPSIHSHSQKTHTTDHRKRTRYIINWNKVPKKSHTICRKYAWIKNICLIKKGIKRAPRKTDSPRKQKPPKHKTYAQSFAVKVSNKTVQILRKKVKSHLKIVFERENETFELNDRKKGRRKHFKLSISWFNVSHHHQRQLGSVSVVWEKHFAVI